MNIVVLIKQVPDTETRIKLQDGAVDTSGVKWVANPYDEFATEEALRIKEDRGEGKVTLVSVGPERAKEALKAELAKGADDAVLLKDDAFEGSDALGIARILKAAVEKIGADLVLTGKQGVDLDNAQTGGLLAELLGWAQVSAISELEVGDGKITAHREVEGGMEVVEATLPAVVTCDKALNEPRYASLKGIMAVKRKKLEEWGAADLGIDASTVGEAAARVKEQEVTLPPPREAGRIIEGELPDAVKELARLLREEAKVL